MDAFISFFSYSYLKDEKEVSDLVQNSNDKEEILRILSDYYSLEEEDLNEIWEEYEILSRLEFAVEYKGKNVQLREIVDQIKDGDILTIGSRKRCLILEKYLERRYQKKINPSYFRTPTQMYIAGLNY